MQNCYSYLMEECHHYNDESAGHNIKSIEKYYEEAPLTAVVESTIKQSNKHHFIAVKSVGKIELIAYEDIYWLNSSSNYIEIHLKERTLLHREPLVSLEKKLKGNGFLRVHRSSIINLKKISKIESEQDRYNLISLCNGATVKLSNAYKGSLFNYLCIDEK